MVGVLLNLFRYRRGCLGMHAAEIKCSSESMKFVAILHTEDTQFHNFLQLLLNRMPTEASFDVIVIDLIVLQLFKTWSYSLKKYTS